MAWNKIVKPNTSWTDETKPNTAWSDWINKLLLEDLFYLLLEDWWEILLEDSQILRPYPTTWNKLSKPN